MKLDLSFLWNLIFRLVELGYKIYDILLYEFTVADMTFSIWEAVLGGGLVTFLVLRLAKWFVPVA